MAARLEAPSKVAGGRPAAGAEVEHTLVAPQAHAVHEALVAAAEQAVQHDARGEDLEGAGRGRAGRVVAGVMLGGHAPSFWPRTIVTAASNSLGSSLPTRTTRPFSSSSSTASRPPIL